MADTTEIANALVRWFAAVDRRDWAAARALMATPFHLDYSSLGAGPASDLDPADVLAGWQTLLPGFDATHHQIGNLDIAADGESATVACYVTATHVIAEATEGRVWTVVGSYTIPMAHTDAGWVLAGCTFHFKYQDGNTELPARARERLAQQP
ncbi:MAG: nuclear transport factor 2 family protein [Rhodospirillaceae bacterium]|nr:nuclear transport factor 2 family protein [Rhodospirillaceae bacterium]